MNYDASTYPSPGPPPDNGDVSVDKDFAQRNPLRILIADDNYINRRVLSLLLQRLGYEVKSTESGRDCLNAAMQHTFDLLLIDVDMPDISGIECTQQIRRTGRDYPIVAVTATDPDQSRAKCFAAGMTGYMRKPVQLDELKQTLREASRATEKRATTSLAKYQNGIGRKQKDSDAGQASFGMAT